MRQAHFALPLAAHLRGRLSLAEAKAEVIALCRDYAERQLKMLEHCDDIVWFEHDKADPRATAERIAASLTLGPGLDADGVLELP